MKKVLALAAIAEAGTGLILLVYPPIAVRLLLGSEITGAGIAVSRLYGVCLIALVMACWTSSTPRREFYAMLTYSTFVMLFLAFVGFTGFTGILTWPAVAVHAALSILLVWAWRKEQRFHAIRT